MTSNSNNSFMNTNAPSIFQKGIFSAKDSFEKFLNSPIKIEEINYQQSELEIDQMSAKRNFHLLKTELNGDIDGVSYLIFSDREIEKIVKACLPESFWNQDTEAQIQMRTEFLNEIDNILASSVITEMANELDLFLYGGVPQPDQISRNEINGFIKEQAITFDTVFQFKAVFQGQEIDINPNFLWMFNSQAMEKIAV